MQTEGSIVNGGIFGQPRVPVCVKIESSMCVVFWGLWGLGGLESCFRIHGFVNVRGNRSHRESPGRLETHKTPRGPTSRRVYFRTHRHLTITSRSIAQSLAMFSTSTALSHKIKRANESRCGQRRGTAAGHPHDSSNSILRQRLALPV